MSERTEPPELPPAPDDLANFWGSKEGLSATEEDAIDVGAELQELSLERQPSASSDGGSSNAGDSTRLHGGSSGVLFAGQEEVRCMPSFKVLFGETAQCSSWPAGAIFAGHKHH